MQRIKPTVHQLLRKAIDDRVKIRRVADDKLNQVLQGIITLRLSVQASLVPLLLLKHRHLEDNVASELGRFVLKAAEKFDGDVFNPMKTQYFWNSKALIPPIIVVSRLVSTRCQVVTHWKKSLRVERLHPPIEGRTTDAKGARGGTSVPAMSSQGGDHEGALARLRWF